VLAEHGGGPRVILVADQAIAERDFTDGEATVLWERLVASGSKVVTQAHLAAALQAFSPGS
jgi:hypothetical protein